MNRALNLCHHCNSLVYVPGVYAGDTTYSTQLLVEIVSNAVDEFRLGHGDKIEVEIKEDASPVTMADKAADLIISSYLKERFPTYAFLTSD